MQRVLDVLLSALALLVVSPLLLLLAILLRLTGEGEVFYLQSRVGRGGRMFNVCKFATMVTNSENIGSGTVTLKNDPRILPVGHFLRRTKLNELPQLINILNGTMSIIGPRPQTQRCFDAFSKRSQQAIKKLRPGLSGIGSIVFYNEEEMMHQDADPERLFDEVIMPYKGLLEEWYEGHQGLKTYSTLILLTLWVMFRSDGTIAWKAFPSLPKPDGRVAALLKLDARA
jgi:lipopolysaccharide/colanic/teichoic acid biosynthesis glycosyltransferase